MSVTIHDRSDGFQRALMTAFESGDHRNVLNMCGAISDELSPFYTVAKAWELLSAGAVGDDRVLARLLPDDTVLTIDASCALLSDRQEGVHLECAKAIETAPRVKPSERMPYIRANKTNNILEADPAATRTIEELFSRCFAAYLERHGKDALLRRLHGRTYTVAWLNFVEPEGALGAHFHPGALLSAVYYPFPGVHERVPDSETNSSITFGTYPAEMGDGRGIPKVEVEARFGRAIVFPSYYGHGVATQSGLRGRVSLASDLMIAS